MHQLKKTLTAGLVLTAAVTGLGVPAAHAAGSTAAKYHTNEMMASRVDCTTLRIATDWADDGLTRAHVVVKWKGGSIDYTGKGNGKPALMSVEASRPMGGGEAWNRDFKSGKMPAGAFRATITVSNADNPKFPQLHSTGQWSIPGCAGGAAKALPGKEMKIPQLVGKGISAKGNWQVGQTVTIDEGNWTPKVDEFTYEWDRVQDGMYNPIKGATGKSYTLTKADQGQEIIIMVTGWSHSALSGMGFPDQTYKVS